MKKIRLNESELVSLVKTIIMEQFTNVKNEGKLVYRDLSYDEKEKIKREGEKVFLLIKNFRDEKTGNDINHWLMKYGLSVSVPGESFLIKNIQDVTFALNNLPLSEKKRKNLQESLDFLQLQIENPDSKFIVLFHEEKNEWSICNMFDNNVILWINLINNRIEKNNISDSKEYLKTYFQGGIESEAAHDLLRAMLFDRHIHKEKIFKKTWGGGKETEKNFYKELIKLGFHADDFIIFSGEGNFVDRNGIDAAIKCNGKWIPVQIKPNQNDAINTIPYKGISVYPTSSNEFYYFCDKKEPSKNISNIVNNCAIGLPIC